jgi:hypothetical protein
MATERIPALLLGSAPGKFLGYVSLPWTAVW